MRLVLASLFLTLGVSQAAALCDAGSTTVLSCTTGRGTKQLDACITGDRVTYRFGPHTAPDLRLSAPIKEVAHQPWPGIGRAIWESTTFRNGAFSYEVYGAYDKIDQTSSLLLLCMCEYYIRSCLDRLDSDHALVQRY